MENEVVPQTLDQQIAALKKIVAAGKATTIQLIELGKLAQQKQTAEQTAKVEALKGTGLKLKAEFEAIINKFVDAKELDAADGVWFAWDFSEKLVDIRLVKSPSKPPAKGKGGGKSTTGESTEALLARFGSEVMVPETKTMTINKVLTELKAGTTFNQAHALSTDGNWRFIVRGALLKKAG